uniref:ATP-dependent DNA helicase n=1 Tax=Tetranychus urticae TaxID=32264 RepID=T1K3S0_TETUR
MVQGKAGSGKSFLIEKLANEFKSSLGEDSVVILAPTGVAACNINGKTIHSFLSIGVDGFSPLQGETLRNFQFKMEKVKVLIFDEMSMIGLTMLAKISQRLQEGRGSSQEPFGGYIVYFFGDMQQLPPVKNSAWYSEIENPKTAMGKLLSGTIERYYKLTTCHRQAGDDQRNFRELLDGVALGNISENMYSLLMSRRVSALDAFEVAGFRNAVHIYPTKVLVEKYNEEHLRKTGNPVAKIPARHNYPQGANATEDQAQGLANELYLSVGCKVMLRSNLWTECGLVNGSMGIVRKIRYLEGERPTSLPAAIMVEFEKYNGPTYDDGYVPITPLKRSWKIGENTVTRTQFPLAVAHAITAHKSQGLTLDKLL